MSQAIILEKHGGPEVLSLKDISLSPLREGEVTISHTAIGINFIDILHRKGIIETRVPSVLGYEGCGYVTKIMGNVGALKIGDRVCYLNAPMGAYCYERNIAAKYLLSIPDEITDEQVAGCLFKAVTAHYLLRRVFFVRKDMFILVHAAAGGVGLFLCQLAKYYGAKVIGTASSDEKVALAKENGCDYPINYNNSDFEKEVMKITKNQGVCTVFDSVGADTFMKSINCLTENGLMVTFGESSGPVSPFDVKILSPKSLFLTRPVLFNYEKNKLELILAANEIFTMLSKGIIKDNIKHRYNLSQASEAHSLMEQRKTSGSSIFVV